MTVRKLGYAHYGYTKQEKKRKEEVIYSKIQAQVSKKVKYNEGCRSPMGKLEILSVAVRGSEETCDQIVRP